MRALLLVLFAGCNDLPPARYPDMASSQMLLTVSADFAGGSIPVKYAWDTQCGAGAMNVSPPLTIGNIPASARSLAIVMLDGDAFSFVHWLAWDIPVIGATTRIAEGAASMFKQGANDYGATGYGGPCPPPGERHEYYFTVYAFEVASLGLSPGATGPQLSSAAVGKVVAQGEMSATYATP